MVSTVLRYLLFLVGMMVIHLSRCLSAAFGRGLCLPRSVASLSSGSLGVPDLPGPHGFWVSCLVATRFPRCVYPLFSLAEEVAYWHYPLCAVQDARGYLRALVQRTLHQPWILRNPVSGSESTGLSSTASPQASFSGASRSVRRQLSAPSPSGLSG